MITTSQFVGGLMGIVLVLFFWSLYHTWLYSGLFNYYTNRKHYKKIWAKVKKIILSNEVKSVTSTETYTDYCIDCGLHVIFRNLYHDIVIQDVKYYDTSKFYMTLPWIYYIKAWLVFIRCDIRDARKEHREKKQVRQEEVQETHQKQLNYLDSLIKKSKGGK